MYRTQNDIKEFLNGNINIRFTPDTIEEARKDFLLTFCDVLESFDCYLIGETYCLSNYTTGHTIYNCHSDLCYIFNCGNAEKLMQGGTVKLYARIPDDADREIIDEG